MFSNLDISQLRLFQHEHLPTGANWDVCLRQAFFRHRGQNSTEKNLKTQWKFAQNSTKICLKLSFPASPIFLIALSFPSAFSFTFHTVIVMIIIGDDNRKLMLLFDNSYLYQISTIFVQNSTIFFPKLNNLFAQN